MKSYEKSPTMPPPPPFPLSNGLLPITSPAGKAEAEESIKNLLLSARRSEQELASEEETLASQKVRLRRELKLLEYQQSSRFSARPTLHGRYVLASLLGRGGFSEVWKCYDLVSMAFRAVKIHQLDARWSDDKKRR